MTRKSTYRNGIQSRLSKDGTHLEYRALAHWSDETGRHTSKTGWMNSEADARTAAAKRIHRAHTCEHEKKSVLERITVAEALDAYHDFLDTTKLSDEVASSTLLSNSKRCEGIHNALKAQWPAYANRPMRELTGEDIAGLMDWLRRDYTLRGNGKKKSVKKDKERHGCSPGYLKTLRSFLANWIRWCGRKNYFSGHDASSINYAATLRTILYDEEIRMPRKDGDSNYMTSEQFHQCMTALGMAYDAAIAAREKQKAGMTIAEILREDDGEILYGTADGNTGTLSAPASPLLSPDGRDVSTELYYSALFTLMFYQGPRTEEIRALRWRCIPSTYTLLIIDSANNQRVRKDDRKLYTEQYAKTKTSSSVRDIPLISPASILMRIYHDVLEYVHPDRVRPDSLIFPARRSPTAMITSNPIMHMLYKIEDDAGVPRVTPHGMRHSTAHYFCDELELSREKAYAYMGHSDSTMLRDVYARRSARRNTMTMTADYIDQMEDGPEKTAYLQLPAEKRRLVDYRAVPPVTAIDLLKEETEAGKAADKILKLYAQYKKMKHADAVPAPTRATLMKMSKEDRDSELLSIQALITVTEPPQHKGRKKKDPQ